MKMEINKMSKERSLFWGARTEPKMCESSWTTPLGTQNRRFWGQNGWFIAAVTLEPFLNSKNIFHTLPFSLYLQGRKVLVTRFPGKMMSRQPIPERRQKPLGASVSKSIQRTRGWDFPHHFILSCLPIQARPHLPFHTTAAWQRQHLTQGWARSSFIVIT